MNDKWTYKMALYFKSACKPKWWHIEYHQNKRAERMERIIMNLN